MQIASLSTLKQRKISIPKNLLDSLEMYSQYISEKEGQKYKVDDIIASAALASKPKQSKYVPTEVAIKLPEAAWEGLRQMGNGSLQGGLTEVYKQLEGLAKENDFKKWKEDNTH